MLVNDSFSLHPFVFVNIHVLSQKNYIVVSNSIALRMCGMSVHDILGSAGVSDNDSDEDEDDDSDDDDDETGQDLSLEIDDLVKGLIPGKIGFIIDLMMTNPQCTVIASEWASLSVHVFFLYRAACWT